MKVIFDTDAGDEIETVRLVMRAVDLSLAHYDIHNMARALMKYSEEGKTITPEELWDKLWAIWGARDIDPAGD